MAFADTVIITIVPGGDNGNDGRDNDSNEPF